VVTAWGLLFAIVVVVRAFGWTGGKTLVAQSYGQAREKSSEQSAARKAKRQAKRDARRHRGSADDADETPDQQVQSHPGREGDREQASVAGEPQIDALE
jgi:hypothetical protein